MSSSVRRSESSAFLRSINFDSVKNLSSFARLGSEDICPYVALAP